MARSLVNYGLNPCLGLYHDNQLNAFNLADDFMEILRPVVDCYVAAQEDTEQWSVEIRADLVNLANTSIMISNEKYSVTTAIDEMVKSFISCCRNQDYTLLKLPNLLPLRVHQYE